MGQHGFVVCLAGDPGRAATWRTASSARQGKAGDTLCMGARHRADHLDERD